MLMRYVGETKCVSMKALCKYLRLLPEVLEFYKYIQGRVQPCLSGCCTSNILPYSIFICNCGGQAIGGFCHLKFVRRFRQLLKQWCWHQCLKVSGLHYYIQGSTFLQTKIEVFIPCDDVTTVQVVAKLLFDTKV